MANSKKSNNKISLLNTELPEIDTDSLLSKPIDARLYLDQDDPSSIKLNEYSSVVTQDSGRLTLGKPFAPGSVLTGFDSTARVMSEIANSAPFIEAQNAISAAHELSETVIKLIEPTAKLSEAFEIISQPLTRLQGSILGLKKYDFTLDNISLTPPLGEVWETGPLTIPKTETIKTVEPSISEVKTALTSLMVQANNIKQEIIIEVTETIRKEFDKLTENNIITNVETRDQIIYCKSCGEYIIKVKNALLFIVALRSQKCPKCEKMLKGAADFKITEV